MAAFLAPRSLFRYAEVARLRGRGLSETRRGSGGGSCEPPEAVPCPPCVPAPQPACRPPPPSVGPRGLKQVCCAPSVGWRPPCAPPTPTCPKTCRDSIDRNTNVSNCGFFGCEHDGHERCGDSLDRVARRLAASELARRLDYEREVAERKPAPEYEPVAYKLAGERQCLRATDGCDYTVSGEQKTQPRCGPCRATPPPCPLDLDLADNCQINRGQYSDPCAHRPRVFVEIDRSQNSLSEDTSNNFKTNSNNENPDRTDGLRGDSSAKSLTTRVIETIKGGGSGCPRKTCKRSCSSMGAQYVGDKRWCGSLPPPAATPRQCKEPSLTERLRRRSGGTCSEPCSSRRRLHSKTCTEKPIETKTDNNISPSKSGSDRLHTLLLERTQLKETGLGRVMLPQKQIKETKSLGTGVIELKIPPNSDSVRVHVSLNFDKTESSIRGERSTSEFECTRNLSSSVNESSGSWLSIKNLQKKITGCRLDDQDRKSEKSADLGTSKPKPKCDKEAGPRGETPMCPGPRQTLTQRKPPPPCPPSIKRSIKTDLINTIHL